MVHLAAELLNGVSLDMEDGADDSDVDGASDLDDLLAAGTPTNDVSEDELDSDSDEHDGPSTTGRAAKALLPTEDRQVCWLEVLVLHYYSRIRKTFHAGVSHVASSIVSCTTYSHCAHQKSGLFGL